MIRLVVLACLLALAGCAALPPGAPSSTPTSPARVDRYDAVPGRDAAMLARLRAAPAPAEPAITEGSDPRGDRNQLATQGFALIGTGHFPRDAVAARAAARLKGKEVGAERVLLYPPAAADDAGGEWVAAYYVKLRLAFGATFRNLHSAERERLGQGGVAIGKVLPNTPASLANIRPGDVVLALDGEPVGDRASFQRLLERAIGRRAVLTLVRNGERLQRTVRLGGAPAR
jgi:hypothetical protein